MPAAPQVKGIRLTKHTELGLHRILEKDSIPPLLLQDLRQSLVRRVKDFMARTD